MTSIEEQGQTFELPASCLCQAHRFTATVPRSLLPLEATYCHCTSCRHVTGNLYTSSIPWPGDGTAIRDSSLRRYKFSARLTVLFCDVCSSPMFVEKPAVEGGSSSYIALTGVLENVKIPGLLRIANHIFVGDTLDGGASPWLCGGDEGRGARVWKGFSDQSEELFPRTPTSETNTGHPQVADPEISVRCHCGGVDLVLHNPIAEFSSMERSELPWFVDPVSNKSLCTFDPCNSCRLFFGIDMVYWTFTPLRHLAFPPTSDQHAQCGFPKSTRDLETAVRATGTNRDPRLGTLATYKSSPDVQRYFCNRCSACVFYAVDERPELVDLAVGLLHSKEGSRAEGLLSWNFGDTSWQGEVAGGWREGFTSSIHNAAERWRIDRGYPKNWRRERKEKAAMMAST
ncbi:Mss4-like protein [Xylaria nigripes]|nr:Mss4-like protein [Xylaria nigripes]